jgi:hypothetical protein
MGKDQVAGGKGDTVEAVLAEIGQILHLALEDIHRIRADLRNLHLFGPQCDGNIAAFGQARNRAGGEGAVHRRDVDLGQIAGQPDDATGEGGDGADEARDKAASSGYS